MDNKPVMLSIAARYVSAAAIMSALYSLVILGKMPPSDFVNLCILVIGALGGFHARGASPPEQK